MMRAVNMTRVQAFTPVKINRPFPIRATRVAAKADSAPDRESSKVVESLIESRLPATLLGLSPLLLAQDAVAKGGQYGLLEGRSVALLHPVLMGALLAATVYAGWTGLKWRRTRTIGQDIKQAKGALPEKGEDGQFVTAPAPGLEARIAELETERKDLSKGNFRDKHYNMGSILLGGGVTMAVAGCVNTYMRTERLFPGPHLFAGAGIVALWALAASLVPAMQRGNETARSLHIGLNTVNLALFLWQVPTGLEIVGKVFQFTSWP